ncbi:MAG: hypothetical protein KGI08_09610, partial [Thaumarchaeota archaeon]|nr:hypothetical protein [Nitrososphaerota archaeon]
MNESEYNMQIEKIAFMITEDNTSLDEQEPSKLQKYYDFVKKQFSLDGDPAIQLVNEAFLYL